MHRIRISRRSLLSSAAAVAGGLLLAGCGEDKEMVKIREADPAEKAKDSMDFYKKNMLKKGGR